MEWGCRTAVWVACGEFVRLRDSLGKRMSDRRLDRLRESVRMQVLRRLPKGWDPGGGAIWEEAVYPYYVTFFVSILFCALGEHEFLKRRWVSYPSILLAVMGPVILAGARDYSIGMDISTYGNYVFETAYHYNRLAAYMRTHRTIEPLYKAMAFVVSRFTDNPHWFYFVTALIICACTMGGLLYYFCRGWCPLTPAWACFLFIIYGDTLNIMRQSIAVAIAFAAFPLFLEKKYVLYSAVQAIAILFHVTGIIAFCLPLLYLFMKVFREKWIYIVAIILCFAAIQLYSPMLAYLIKIHVLPAKFSRYLASGFAFALNPTILRLPFLLPILYFYDRFCTFDTSDVNLLPVVKARIFKFHLTLLSKIKTRFNWGFKWMDIEGEEHQKSNSVDPVLGTMVVFLLLLEICTVQLRSVLPALYRISYYFSYYKFIGYSRLTKILRRDNRVIVLLALIAYLCILWYYQNVIQGNNCIYPYIYADDWFHKIIYFSTSQ